MCSEIQLKGKTKFMPFLSELFKNIISGIQFNDKKYNKKLKHCWYMNRKSIYKIVLIYSKLIFGSTISRDHLQSEDGHFEDGLWKL